MAQMIFRVGGCMERVACRGGAVELFERLRERHPADPDVAELLEKAVEARWTYDW